MREEQQELWDNYKAWLLEQAKDKANAVKRSSLQDLFAARDETKKLTLPVSLLPK